MIYGYQIKDNYLLNQREREEWMGTIKQNLKCYTKLMPNSSSLSYLVANCTYHQYTNYHLLAAQQKPYKKA